MVSAPDPFGFEEAFELFDQLLDEIEADIAAQPRSHQRLIGPSEIGDPCDRCLTRKLAGLTEPNDVAWLPYIGTAMHAKLEKVFHGRRGWLVEQRVKVGTLAGQPIEGTADLFHIPSGTVVDWKCVGIGTLRSVRQSGASQTYRVQAHAYGRGFHRDYGLAVNHVAIVYLPRNMPTLRDQVATWSQPYDEQVAVDALARCERILADIDAVRGAVSEPRWVPSSLDAYANTQPAVDGCYGCKRRDEAA